MYITRGKLGESIHRAAERAVNIAHVHNVAEVGLVFNEVNLIVSRFSHADDIAQIYNLKLRLAYANSTAPTAA